MVLTRADAINKKIASTNKILATITTGVVFLLFPIVIKIVDPVPTIVNYLLRVANGSIVYELVQDEMPVAELSIYLFNVTNADRFLSGEDDKLKVEEVGPFVFQEYRWYVDVVLSEDGKELGMTPKVRIEFIPEASIAHPKDVMLTVPNLPFLSGASLISNYPSFIRTAFNMVVGPLGEKAFMQLDGDRYLNGFESRVLQICNSLAPGFVYFDDFGLLKRLYENESEYRIVVGATNEDRFKIKSVKKFRHIELGTIKDVDVSEQIFEKDTYEGAIYPPMLTPDVPINWYRLGICKTFNLQYLETRNMHYGGEAFIYTISNETFGASVNPLNKKPYPSGVLDISDCAFGLPFVISKAHFLDSDPKLYERIEGITPNRDLDDTTIIIDKKVGVMYNTKMSIQLTMMLGDLDFNWQSKMLSHAVVPVIRIEVNQPKLTEWTLSKLVLVYQLAPYIVIALQILSALIGTLLVTYAARLQYLNWMSKTRTIVFETVDIQAKLKAELPLIPK
ncbi:scavenger receptor class B member 1-like [Spodoptera litura]|uniref:Scavenger receptor class B member 1 n=1 Tax=Spodoptera litura TaxID=69820 RepID=A0A9J7ECL8_SPOLT|nr:scavenger receptor class B member 1-like [Spodoptera litura]XP_022826237.1 scavenger receptor class B member 1-like [Spodoptera litura]XP_022826238.1 scavenger receptor class B member 1-like [Spodoptera litura]